MRTIKYLDLKQDLIGTKRGIFRNKRTSRENRFAINKNKLWQIQVLTNIISHQLTWAGAWFNSSSNSSSAMVQTDPLVLQNIHKKLHILRQQDFFTNNWLTPLWSKHSNYWSTTHTPWQCENRIVCFGWARPDKRKHQFTSDSRQSSGHLLLE